MVRRLIFCGLAFFVTESSPIAIQALVLSNVFVQIYFGLVRPRDDRKANWLELINEFLMNTSCMHLLFFTEFVPDPEAGYLMGFSMVGVISLLIIINLCVILYYSIRSFSLLVYKYGAILLVKVGFIKAPISTKDHIDEAKKNKELILIHAFNQETLSYDTEYVLDFRGLYQKQVVDLKTKKPAKWVPHTN